MNEPKCRFYFQAFPPLWSLFQILSFICVLFFSAFNVPSHFWSVFFNYCCYLLVCFKILLCCASLLLRQKKLTLCKMYKSTFFCLSEHTLSQSSVSSAHRIVPLWKWSYNKPKVITDFSHLIVCLICHLWENKCLTSHWTIISCTCKLMGFKF